MITAGVKSILFIVRKYLKKIKIKGKNYS